MPGIRSLNRKIGKRVSGNREGRKWLCGGEVMGLKEYLRGVLIDGVDGYDSGGDWIEMVIRTILGDKVYSRWVRESLGGGKRLRDRRRKVEVEMMKMIAHIKGLDIQAVRKAMYGFTLKGVKLRERVFDVHNLGELADYLVCGGSPETWRLPCSRCEMSGNALWVKRYTRWLVVNGRRYLVWYYRLKDKQGWVVAHIHPYSGEYRVYARSLELAEELIRGKLGTGKWRKGGAIEDGASNGALVRKYYEDKELQDELQPILLLQGGRMEDIDVDWNFDTVED